jgi:hypothetical protein
VRDVSRYLAPAAAIVFAFIALALGFGRWNEARHSRYSDVSASPGRPHPEATVSSSPRPVEGNAPWALSALPECFRQKAVLAGTVAFVRASKFKIVDANARRVVGTVRVADCTLSIERDRAFVERGDNHLIVPPSAIFYFKEKDDRLILDRQSRGREELRVYAWAPGTVPAVSWTPVQPAPGGVHTP